MDIIDIIADNKRREVEAMKQIVSEERLFALARQLKRQPLSLKGALRGNYSGVIAEFKRRSPAKGSINPTADVASVVSGYARYGAAACSIVTDYGGTLDTNARHWAHVLWDAYRAAAVPVSEAAFREAYVYAERYLAKNPVIAPEDDFAVLLQKKLDIATAYLQAQGFWQIAGEEQEIGRAHV